MSAPEFMARLAFRSRGLVERAVPSVAPLFAPGPDGATWGRADAGTRVGTELDPEQAVTVTGPSRPTSARPIRQHAAALPEDRAPARTHDPVPPVESGQVTVPPPPDPERAAAGVARSSVDTQDQLQALVRSILDQRPADRTDDGQVDRPARTHLAGDPSGPDAVPRPGRPATGTNSATAPPTRAAREHHPIARPAPTPPADRSRRTHRPVVRITIGRLEVRAQSTSAPARPSAPSARPSALGLDEYLRRRSRGSR